MRGLLAREARLPIRASGRELPELGDKNVESLASLRNLRCISKILPGLEFGQTVSLHRLRQRIDQVHGSHTTLNS